jgi:uncharacterized protein GlcG (DUF336 family)
MLTLATAQTIIESALAEQARIRAAPLSVAVLDASGHRVAFGRQDGAGIAGFDIAFAKAWGSLGMGLGSRELAERAAKNPTFIATLSVVAGGRIAPSPGGALILDRAGVVIGAVGISGDVGDNDETCAVQGVQAAGLTAATGSIP